MDKPTADALADLAERVSRLEGAAARAASPRPSASFPFDLGDDAGTDAVTYVGHGQRDGDPIAWHVRRTWDEVLASAGDGLGATLSALASGPRLRIVAELVAGPVSTGDLAERLDQGSTGQLFHHLKELLAVGVVHQPQRGVYTIRPAHVVPVLAILSAAMDLTTHSPGAIAETTKEPS
jgi:DNA-binding transcriptional ArsR family regulator